MSKDKQYFLASDGKLFLLATALFCFCFASAQNNCSAFDLTSQAYDFGILATGVKSTRYRVECQTVDGPSETCSSLSNSMEYTKSTWQIFTTPNYFDHLSMIIANQNVPAGHTYGFNIYKGDVRSSPGTLVSGCHSMTSNAYRSAQYSFSCSDLDPNTTYSIQIFYHQSFTDSVELSLVTAGIVPTALPQPVLSSLIGNNAMTVTPTTPGVSFNPQDYFGCNSRHSITACGAALPSGGILFKGRNFDLSTFFSVDLTSAATVNLSATPSCGPSLLIRVFRQALTNNCSDLDPANIVGEGIGTAGLPYCLPAGKYVVQVSGTDSVVDNSFPYGTLTAGNAPCLLSNLGSFFSLNLAAATPVPKMERVDSTLCSGQAYTLSNGTKVNTSNTYPDTLRTVNGCDSLVRVLNLQFKQKTVQSFFASFCGSQSYTLPSGKVVNAPGDYSDTLKYTSGCDSLIRVVHLEPASPKRVMVDSYICEGDSLQLSWGPMVKTGGSYNDTIRTVAGCDSIIWMVGVYVRPRPAVTVSKSNDISCALGSARLTATGGFTYAWSPATGLDRADVFNPVASPAATTTYHVKARSAGGCVAEDSIQLLVSLVSSGNSFLVPNSFTPNGDGVNDCFGLRHWGAVTDLHFAVYDRWGKRVFYTQEVDHCWDGSFNGTPLPAGTFIYTIDAKSACGAVVRKGTVTLVR